MKFCPNDGTRLRQLSINSDGEDEDPLLGQDIEGRFHVERVLGEGGMGKVYGGKQLSVNREVAIKVLRSELASDEKIVKRFFREAQVISKFSHPNIVSLVDFGQDVERNVLYLAMEYIDGTELSELLGGYRLAPALAVDIMIQACEALSEPHERGVVHRDLKPENLMLLTRSDGRIQAKVVDFGIAYAIQTNTKLTQTGSVFGTPYYMAPEQAQGGDVSAATDVYALGCILFELLTGSVPFTGETAMELLMKHVQEPIPVLAQFLPATEEIEELSELVVRMASKADADRPDSVLAVRDRLEMIQRKYNHPPLRVQSGDSTQEMFSPWLLEAVNPREDNSTVARATDAPLSTYRTDEQLQQALQDTAAVADSPSMTGTGKAPPNTAETPEKHHQGDRNGPAVDPQTDLRGVSVPSTKQKRIKLILIPAAGLLLMTFVVAGLGIAFVFSDDDEEVLGADSQEVAVDAEPEEIFDDDALVGEAPVAEEDEDSDEESEEVESDDGDVEKVAAANDEPDEADDTEERSQREDAEQPAEEPTPRPQPTPEVEEPTVEEPTPRPQPRPQPQPEPDDDDTDDRPQLDIFTVD